jgi:hypothetical protein
LPVGDTNGAAPQQEAKMIDDDEDPGAFTSPPMGHNRPPPDEPKAFENARQKIKEAQIVTTEILTITNQGQANKVADTLRDVQSAFNELEIHRTNRVAPLNRKVKAINDEYRPLKEGLDKLELDLKTVNRRWLLEQDRLRAEQARKAREEAERLAKEAEEAQRRASDEAERAKDGDITAGPLHPVEAAVEASKATLEARKAEARADAIEKRRPKSGTGAAGRKVGLHTEERLSIATVKDLLAAVKDMGLREGLVEAVLKEARAYRAERSKLPKGITRIEVKV